jgi:diacylglycerol kinase (ATP)
MVDVIVAGAMGRTSLLTAFPRIFAGTHVHLASVSCSRARRVDFDASQPFDLMIDGEVERHLPSSLEVVPAAIDVSL